LFDGDKMLNNGHKIECESVDEIVSYIYDEMSDANRAKFEKHLARCAVCMDEFAVMADTRFSLVEWHNEDFRHLPTPEIVIPYEPKKYSVEQTRSVRLWDGIRTLLAHASLPVMASAGLVICLGLSLLALNYIDRSDKPVASNAAIITPPVTPEKETQVSVNEEPKGRDVAVASAVKTGNYDIRPVKAVVHRRSHVVKQTYARNLSTQDPTPTIKDTPVLSSYEENDDNSLRLAELFDEVGG